MSPIKKEGKEEVYECVVDRECDGCCVMYAGR